MSEAYPRPPAMPAPVNEHPSLMLNKLAAWVHGWLDVVMADEGLKARHYLVMSAIRSHHGQQELAVKLGIDKATMVAIMAELERRELIERMRDPEDRRQYKLWHTEAGASWLTMADAKVTRAERQMFEPLEAVEVKELLRLLNALCLPPE